MAGMSTLNGHVAALAAFGLEKEARWFRNPRLMSTLAGAGLGGALARDGEGLQGAVLGGTTGYIAGAGMARGAQALGRGVAALKNRVSGAVTARQPMNQARAAWGDYAQAHAQQAAKTNNGRAHWKATTGAGLDQQLRTHMATARGLPAGGAAMPPSGARRPTGPMYPHGGGFRGSEDGMIVTAAARALQTFGLDKTAFLEFGTGFPIPGLPIQPGVSLKPKDERLPGMDSWVDRNVIERAMKGTREGLDAQALVDLEGDRGRFKTPLTAAALAAALTKYKMPSAGNTGAILAGLIGAGGGALYHNATEGSRRDSMVDALRGVYTERGSFPLQGQQDATSNEPHAMLLSRAGAAT